jgi:synaptobrevin family protein YKT6
MKLQGDLNDITNTMKQNLNELLKRGESLDALMSKSNDLSSGSLMFYKNAKKANSKCCNLY